MLREGSKRIIVGLGLLGPSGVASAGVPVVFDGIDGTEAAALVSEHSGMAETEYDAVPLATLRQSPPDARGDVVLRRCAKTPTERDPIRADYARAKAAFVQNDRFDAMDHLDLAVAKLGCLSQVVDREVASLVFAFRGALGATADVPDLETARGEFRTALELNPALGYPDWLPPGAEPLFDRVQTELAAETERSRLEVIPSSTVSGPWVDGVEATDKSELRTGLHLLQYSSVQGIRSGWLSVAGPGQLVLPSQMRGPLLDAMGTEDGQALVAALVDVAVPDFASAYVTHAGGLWLLTKQDDGEVRTLELQAPDDAEPEATPEPDEGKKKKRKKRRRK